MGWSVLATAVAHLVRRDAANQIGKRAVELRPVSASRAARELILRYRLTDSVESWNMRQREAPLIDEPD